jgi:hypothetical protein
MYVVILTESVFNLEKIASAKFDSSQEAKAGWNTISTKWTIYVCYLQKSEGEKKHPKTKQRTAKHKEAPENETPQYQHECGALVSKP